MWARKGIVKKCNSNDYPLTGILYCARCGNRFQGCVNAATRENKRTKTKRRYYRCSARQTYDIDCDNYYARADELESEVYGIISAIFSQDIDDARLLNLVRNSSVSDTGDIEQEIGEQKRKLEENLSKQEKLSKIYSEGLLAIEVYRKQVMPLRDEEKEIKSRIKNLELSLIERERNEEYLRLIKDVVDHFETTDEKMDLISKKGLLKILFRYIKIDNGRIKDFDLYEPYKSLYKGVPLKWEVQENQILTTGKANVSTLLPTVVR